MTEIEIQGEHDPLCFPAIRDVRIGDWGPSCFTCEVLGMAEQRGREKSCERDSFRSMDTPAHRDYREAGYKYGYEIGQKDADETWLKYGPVQEAIDEALQRTLDALDSLNYEHLIDPDNCECVACEDAAIILAAVKGEKFDIHMKFGIRPSIVAPNECLCVCHESISRIDPHPNEKCQCNGGTGMETL